ncbi:MAG: transglycosylase SLT domain-containing protein [Pseudanabaenaceae cyanobacterium SKYGB_i_bin29]|nr:transglycosylase SLT domain-containing protein [Pseudanabaenaceae cyanobacterium SKYG29]MDW8421384.1 transglycosylase SLT domain-containing protein [Pseudanabaenaceae cyanobacterium SKYGB_i_bin29]
MQKWWFSWVLLLGSLGIAGLNFYNLTLMAKQGEKIVAPSVTKLTDLPSPTPFVRSVALSVTEQISYHAQQVKTDSAQAHRHRYVLANLYLRQGQPEQALALLADLEKSYPLLTEYIWLKRSQALLQLGRKEEAATLQANILNRFPSTAVAATVTHDRQEIDTLIRRYPAHPLAKKYLKERSLANPDLLVSLVTYFPDDVDILPYLDRASRLRLTPDQWWAVADGYYDQFVFTKAADAYSKATPNAITAYRLARSYHRADRHDSAISAYRGVVERYPQSPEAPRALLRLVQLLPPEQAVAIADRIVERYPSAGAEALLAKFYIERDLLKTNPQLTFKTLIQKFPQSDSAAQLLLERAKEQARSGQFLDAIATVRQLQLQNQTSEAAAEAGFWAGKWSEKIGDRSGAQQLYRHVLRHHPESYYAWRSATALGMPVGSLGGVEQVRYDLQPIATRAPLPTGSPVLQELYLLGEDQDATELWQFTTRGKRVLNVREIFTDGIMRVLAGDYLLGIKQIDSLDWIDVSPQEASQIPELKKHPDRLPFLYPLAYQEIVQTRATERNLHPALVFGLIRQESRFEKGIRSSADAVGLMQIIPETAAWIASKLGRKNYSMTNPQDNVEFGTWYLRYTHSRYQNNTMLAVASYNAGPGAVANWVQGGVGDVDEFVERIPYRETRDYVKKVFANYWNYLRIYSPTLQNHIANTVREIG